MKTCGLLEESSNFIWENLKNSRSKLQYMLLFSLAPIFGNVKITFGTGSEMLFGMSGIYAMGLAYALGTLFMALFIRAKDLHRYAKVLSFLALLFFVLISLFREGFFVSVGMMLFGLCYGACSAIALFGFTYALQPKERFIGAGLTVFYTIVFQIICALPFLTPISGRLYLGAQVIGTFLCFYRYKPEDYVPSLAGEKTKSNSIIGVAIFFYAAHKIIMYFYSKLPPDMPDMLIGLIALLIIVCAMLIYFLVRFNIVHLCSLFFGGMIISYVLHLVSRYANVEILGDMTQSFGYMGFIASYYLLGSAMQERLDYKGFQKFLLAMLCLQLLVQILPSFLANRFPDGLIFFSLSLTVLFFIVFALLIPILIVHLFPSNPPAEDPAEKRRKLMLKYDLSEREQELAELLYQGKLFKECALVLEISIDTVRYHSKNLYRKLGINGRNALAGFFDENTKKQDAEENNEE